MLRQPPAATVQSVPGRACPLPQLCLDDDKRHGRERCQSSGTQRAVRDEDGRPSPRVSGACALLCATETNVDGGSTGECSGQMQMNAYLADYGLETRRRLETESAMWPQGIRIDTMHVRLYTGSASEGTSMLRGNQHDAVYAVHACSAKVEAAKCSEQGIMQERQAQGCRHPQPGTV